MTNENGVPMEERALRLFAELLGRRSRPDGHAIEALCQAHPDLEPSLRELAKKRSEVEVHAPRVDAGPIAYLRGRLARRGEVAARARTRYVMLGEVARGGMGVVLHVWDTVLERPLAMKILDPKGFSKGAEADEATQRFLAEAQVAGRLQHPGVVPVHDLGVERRGRVYFTMPVFEGRTLEEVFDLARSRAEGWTIERALLAVAEVCDVVAYAHSRGVIHRDLKPTNVMVKPSGQVCVLDWGLAKLADQAGTEPEASAGSEASPEPKPSDDGRAGGRADATQNGTVAGSPPYMAPEQAQGRAEDVSFRSDVYAIGAILYRLLASRPPYAPRKGKDEPETTIELIRRGAPTPIRKVAPGAAPELVAISEKAMERRPEDRYASAEEIARDLRAFLEGRTSDVVAAEEGHA